MISKQKRKNLIALCSYAAENEKEDRLFKAKIAAMQLGLRWQPK